MRMIRQRRRRLEANAQRANNQQEQMSEGERRIDEAIREYEELLAAHGLQPEDVFTARAFNYEIDAPVQRGLSPERLDQFMQFNAGDAQASVTGKQCAVCLESIASGTRVLRLDCRHTFCAKCILQWLADNNTCPCCRRSF